MKRRKYDRHTCSKNQNMLYQICPAWQQSASTSIYVYSPPDKALELSNVSCLAQLPLFFGTVIGWIQVDIYTFPSAPPCCQKWHTSIMNKREALNWYLNECKSEGLQSWWFMIMHNDVWLGCLSHHEALSGNVAGKAHYTALLQAIQCQSRSHGIHRSRHWTNWAHPTTRLFIEPLVLSIFDFKMFKHLALQMQSLQSSHFAFRLPMPGDARTKWISSNLETYEIWRPKKSFRMFRKADKCFGNPRIGSSNQPGRSVRQWQSWDDGCPLSWTAAVWALQTSKVAPARRRQAIL